MNRPEGEQTQSWAHGDFGSRCTSATEWPWELGKAANHSLGLSLLLSKWRGWSADCRPCLWVTPVSECARTPALCTRVAVELSSIWRRNYSWEKGPKVLQNLGGAVKLKSGSPSSQSRQFEESVALRSKTRIKWKDLNFHPGDITSSPSMCPVLWWAREQQGRKDPSLC